jgi:hypothetical protein
LATDAKDVEMPIGRTLWLAAAAGAFVALCIFFAEIGPRADLASALSTPRFLFKIALTLMLLVSAAGLVLHLARPGAIPSPWLYALAAVPAFLALAVGAEMLVVPPSEWQGRVMGMNWLVCLGLIPLLSAAPLIAAILGLRRGATTHPVMAGAAAGLLAAGIGATLYATHCQSDSPLFVGVWYVAATAVMTGAGALLGARFLRW